MQSVLAAFVEELSNERLELKCVNDLVKTLLAPCLNWEAVLRSVFVLLTRFH